MSVETGNYYLLNFRMQAGHIITRERVVVGESRIMINCPPVHFFVSVG